MEKNTITRIELYDLVWKESLTAIAKRFNIPFTHLRKICSEMSVPIPPNGHWSKLQFGKPVEIIQLPQDYQGESEIKLYPDANDINNPKVLTFNKKSAVDLIKEDTTLPLAVPKKLINPDDLVVVAEKQLTGYTYNGYNVQGMVRSEGALNIRVSRGKIGRALRFMDTLIKVLKARGHRIEANYRHSIHIDDEHFEFKLMEKTEKGPPDSKWGLPTYENTGLLYFEIKGYMGRSWTDGKILIEEQMASILAKIESTIIFWKENHRKNEEARIKREEQERVILEQQQRIEKERSNFQDLYKQAKRWQRARFMRDYINAVEANASDNGGLTTEVQEWLKWATDKVDWYDPLINKEDELLTNKDKKAL
jgi:hypothetical protein